MSAPTPRSPLAHRRDQLAYGLVKPIMHAVQRTRAQQFDTLGPLPGAVVFLGDSITEQGLWSDWLPDVRTSNRGIGGNTTAQILERLDSAVGDSTAAVFVLAGTNDLADGSRPADIARRLGQILDGIARRAPGAPIFAQSVMPRKTSYAAEVLEVNRLLREIVDARPGVAFVDLWPALAVADHSLHPGFTNDALHLNGDGYAAWLDVIRPLVERVTTAVPTR